MAEKKPTKAALLAERRATLGKCKTLTEKGTECRSWAQDEAGYCGTHYATETMKALEANLRASKKARIDAAIDAFLEHKKEHPHIW